MKAIILAAGKGTRMRGICAATPKPMLELANRPILSLIFDRLKDMGVGQVALVVGFEGEQLRDLVGDGRSYGVDVTYVWQEEQLGTAHATLLCEEFVAGDPFVLIFGDILTRFDNYDRMVKTFEREDVDAVLTVFPVDDPSNGAAVDVRDGYVAGIVEKPPPGTILNAYNNAGIFIWPADIFDMIRHLDLSPRGEYEFTDGIVTFIKAGRRLAAFELQGYWENITDPEACIRLNANLLREFLPPAPESVDPSASVAGSTHVSGSAIAEETHVGDGCNIEGSRIGPGGIIGDHVTIRESDVLAGVTIGDGCRIGPQTSIGEGSVIAPGATVGPNVCVGRRCVVGENASLGSTIILNGSRVGPGASLVHVMLAYNAKVGSGETMTGMPEKAIEVLGD